MKINTVITIIVFSIMGNNAFGQDSTLQVDISFFPINYTQEYKEIKNECYGLYYDYEFHYNIGPSLLLTVPINKRFSLTSGLLFFSRKSEFYFQDSTFRNFEFSYTNYIYKYDYNYKEIRVPINMNFILYKNKRTFITSSVGFDIVPKYECKISAMLYPDISSNNIYKFKGYHIIDNTLHFNFALIHYFYNHFGIVIRPYAGYNIAKTDRSPFICGLGLGVCYK